MPSRHPSAKLIWTALFAVWFAALAPSVSAWLASRDRVWVEVCTTQGAQMRLLGAQDLQHDPASAHSGHAHCPYCLLHNDLATPPSATLAVLPPVTLQERQRWQVLALPYQAVAWARLPSRAPPALLS